MTLTDYDIVVDLGLRSWDGKTGKGRSSASGAVMLPKGSSAGLLNGLQHKQFIDDLFLAKRDPGAPRGGRQEGDHSRAAGHRRRRAEEPGALRRRPEGESRIHPEELQTCTQTVENDGHRFGEDLPEADKKALTAFLATL